MYLQELKNILVREKLRQSDIARLAGVSRAAVTQWYRRVREDGSVNLETKTLRKLAEGLKIPIDRLLRPAPDLAPYKTAFLWDGLYPSMETFIEALTHGRLPAVARLIQEIGFSRSIRVIGRKAVTKFPQYKKFIKPVRRHQLETLWPLYISHP